jgi:hypothetical protein
MEDNLRSISRRASRYFGTGSAARKRALFVLTKIDEILSWERQKETERDTRFVDPGKYL